MTPQDMVSAIADDLKHIPDGPDLDIQNELRVLYNSRRRKDLALGKPRNETIAYCIQVIKSMYPGWRPNFNAAYFEIK